MYGLTANPKEMNFPSFAFFFHYHRLFNKYSSRTPFKLTVKEFQKMMLDMEIPMMIRFKIDRSFTAFSQPEYLEASLTLGRKRLDESKYFSFKQDGTLESKASNSKKTVNANAIAFLKNKPAREYFYHINSIRINSESIWNHECMYKAFMYSNLYVRMLEITDGAADGKSFMNNLLKGYETAIPSIGQGIRPNIEMYKYIPDEIHMDLLLFLSINNSMRKLGILHYNDDETVDENNIKIMMKDYGMQNMPDTVLDTGNVGRDKLGRRIFKAAESFKNLVIVQGVAAEKKRGVRDVKVNDLVKNHDPSRKFPLGARRLEKSPLV